MKPRLPFFRTWAAGLGVAASLTNHAATPPAVEIGTETQFSSDITLTQSTVGWFDRAGLWEWNAAVSGATARLDYEPVAEDIFGYATTLSQPRVAGLAAGRYRATPQLTLLASVAAYNGFADYQSIWINEFYQQSFAGLPGLEQPSPRGASGSAGVRWEYRPGTGFIESSLIRAHDVIAPGYNEVIDPDEGLVAVTPGRSEIITLAWNVKFENILTRRLRSQFEFRLASQSETGLRLSGIGALNYAPAEDWVVRWEAGYTTEAPDEEAQSTRFRAGWGAMVVERHLGEHWWLSLSGRGYTDNGEIQDSISFSTSAPPLTAWQLSLGIRGVWGPHSFKLSGGPYFTDYGEVDFSTLFFANLYRDRTYGVIQAAYRYEF
jgi:hypothetical protein